MDTAASNSLLDLPPLTEDEGQKFWRALINGNYDEGTAFFSPGTNNVIRTRIEPSSKAKLKYLLDSGFRAGALIRLINRHPIRMHRDDKLYNVLLLLERMERDKSSLRISDPNFNNVYLGYEMRAPCHSN